MNTHIILKRTSVTVLLMMAVVFRLMAQTETYTYTIVSAFENDEFEAYVNSNDVTSSQSVTGWGTSQTAGNTIVADMKLSSNNWNGRYRINGNTIPTNNSRNTNISQTGVSDGVLGISVKSVQNGNGRNATYSAGKAVYTNKETISAGTYRFSYAVYNFSNSQIGANRTGVLFDGTTIYDDATSFTRNTWVTRHSSPFTIDNETDVTLSVGFETPASNITQCLLFDYVVLEKATTLYTYTIQYENVPIAYANNHSISAVIGSGATVESDGNSITLPQRIDEQHPYTQYLTPSNFGHCVVTVNGGTIIISYDPIYNVSITPANIGGGFSLNGVTDVGNNQFCTNQALNESNIGNHVIPTAVSGYDAVVRIDGQSVTVVYSIGTTEYTIVTENVPSHTGSIITPLNGLTRTGVDTYSLTGAWLTANNWNDYIRFADINGYRYRVTVNGTTITVTYIANLVISRNIRARLTNTSGDNYEADHYNFTNEELAAVLNQFGVTESYFTNENNWLPKGSTPPATPTSGKFYLYALSPTTGEPTLSGATANNWGYWFNNTGAVCSYGDAHATVYAEYVPSSKLFYVGKYPGRLSANDTYSVREVMMYNNGTEVISVWIYFNYTIQESISTDQQVNTWSYSVNVLGDVQGGGLTARNSNVFKWNSSFNVWESSMELDANNLNTYVSAINVNGYSATLNIVGSVITVFYTLNPTQAEPEEGMAELTGQWTREALNNLTLDSDVTSLDLTSIDIPYDVTIPTTANPNLLIYINEDDIYDLNNTQNVIIKRGNNYGCSSLVVTDGYSFGAMVGFTAATAVYERNVNRTWGTLTLPFDIDISECEGIDGFYTLAKIDSESGSSNPWMFFEEFTDDITTFTPIIFKQSGNNHIVIRSSNNTIISITPQHVNSVYTTTGGFADGCTWYLVGSMKAITILAEESPNEIYYIAQDKFWHSTTALNNAAFRCYFETDISLNSSAPAYRMSIIGETTHIEEIETECIKGTSAPIIYDLRGIRLDDSYFDALPPGLYIINGKKTVIR